MFKTHPSVLIIKNKIFQGNKLKLNVKKATTHENIPPKVLKTSAMITAETLQQLFFTPFKMLCLFFKKTIH